MFATVVFGREAQGWGRDDHRKAGTLQTLTASRDSVHCRRSKKLRLGGHGATVTTIYPRDLCGFFVIATDDYVPDPQQSFYLEVVATTATYSCDEGGSIGPGVRVSGGTAGSPGIFLHIAGSPGRSVERTPVYQGSFAIVPNTAYTLSVQRMGACALTRTVLATGVTNGGGHLEGQIQLGALAPGSYKIVMTGYHAWGYPLVLTNHIVVDAAGKFVSVSAESQQPSLN